jgi:hypothetical protein
VSDVGRNRSDPDLLAEGHRARAEILEASPTQRTAGVGEEERRIWSLRLRIHPHGEATFEANVEHGFRLSPDFEEKIERGLSFNMIPVSGGEIEVAYDPDDYGQVIVCPPAGDREPMGIRLQGIAGMPLRQSADTSA